ncbi:MAG: hypothetical protein ABTQ32_25940 [Myxococcaceae bacterium]|jgi:hypothetical protein
MDPATKSLRSETAVGFVLRAALYHSFTYLVFGLMASRLLDYQHALTSPIISDYMKDPASADVGLGPWLQPVRGLLFGVALLPLRPLLAERARGWLIIWGLFLAIGILGTPAAAPSSLEGLVYSRLPLWYHLFGLPEVVLQTLAFSVLLHRSLRPRPARSASSWRARVLGALAGASFAFIGFAVVSIVFAFALADGFRTEGAQSARTLGVFVAPFLINVAVLVASPLLKVRRAWLVALVTWALNTLALLGYQALVLGAVGWSYVLLAPVLPALIIAAVAHRPVAQAHPTELAGTTS